MFVLFIFQTQNLLFIIVYNAHQKMVLFIAYKLYHEQLLSSMYLLSSVNSILLGLLCGILKLYKFGITSPRLTRVFTTTR